MVQQTTEDSNTFENRVLVFMPTGRDGGLVCSTLENAGIVAQACRDVSDLKEKITSGAGAVLMAEEALADGNIEALADVFNQQPIWSDLPIVLFAINGQNAENLLETIGTRFNATIVERPIRITMLISAVRGALRARQKQYQTRDLLNQLKEADHQKDLFLATLSHELRTPLNSILGWIQLLRSGSQQIDHSHGLDVIERNAKAQTEMISDILFVSRVITGKLTLNLENVDLIPIVKSAIDVVRPSVEAKRIELNASFDLKICKIDADPDRLQQVFLNLLSNAVKFTPSGGQIDVRVINKIQEIEIEISDSGQGIKSEFLPFVFERFRQADNSYTRQVGGLGLGLAIVRHLVELHGGNVSVKSDGDNQGATFSVSLPAPAQADFPASIKDNMRETGERSENEKAFDGISVLLVEDDADSREMLQVMFAQQNIKINAVDSAAKALEAIEQYKPDVLISDVGLPGEDGYELIRKVRQLSPEQGGNTPAIALTGYTSLQDRQNALEVGFQEHLAKPVDIDELLHLVNVLVKQNDSFI